jgi:hypothetical protein
VTTVGDGGARAKGRCRAPRISQATHLVDCVLPAVPIRQFVLSFPFELSRLAATKPEVLRALARIHAAELARHGKQAAKKSGECGELHAGAVTFVQRFGSSLNLLPGSAPIPNVLSARHLARIGGGLLYAATSNVPWATLLARTFDVDVKACARCSGRLEVRAVVTDHDTARKILEAIPTTARAPPIVDTALVYEPAFA